MTLEIVGGGIKPPTVIINKFSAGVNSGIAYLMEASGYSCVPSARSLLNGVGHGGAYIEMVNITGEGVLNYVAAIARASTNALTIKITIDGVVIFEGGTDSNAGGIAHGFHAVGSGIGETAMQSATFDSLPFKSSLVIELKASNANNDSAQLDYVYHLTS